MTGPDWRWRLVAALVVAGVASATATGLVFLFLGIWK